MRRVSNSRTETARTTVVLPRVLDANVDYLCLAWELSKGEIFRHALEREVRDAGLNPHQMPKLPLVKRRPHA